MTRPSPANSSRAPVVGFLPEALDDSEKWASLVLRRIGTEDESLASAEKSGVRFLGVGAGELQGDLLGLLSLLSEDGLGLSTKARLLGSIAARTLGILGVLALLVLSNLVLHVLLAVLAISRDNLRNVHLDTERMAERHTS